VRRKADPAWRKAEVSSVAWTSTTSGGTRVRVAMMFGGSHCRLASWKDTWRDSSKRTRVSTSSSTTRAPSSTLAHASSKAETNLRSPALPQLARGALGARPMLPETTLSPRFIASSDRACSRPPVAKHLGRQLSFERKLAALARYRHRKHARRASRQWLAALAAERLDLRYHSHNAGDRRFVVAFCQRLFRFGDPTNAWIDVHFWVPIASLASETWRAQQTDKADGHCQHLNTLLRDLIFNTPCFGKHCSIALSLWRRAV
jgi:hypothetical protein